MTGKEKENRFLVGYILSGVNDQHARACSLLRCTMFGITAFKEEVFFIDNSLEVNRYVVFVFVFGFGFTFLDPQGTCLNESLSHLRTGAALPHPPAVSKDSGTSAYSSAMQHLCAEAP